MNQQNKNQSDEFDCNSTEISQVNHSITHGSINTEHFSINVIITRKDSKKKRMYSDFATNLLQETHERSKKKIKTSEKNNPVVLKLDKTAIDLILSFLPFNNHFVNLNILSKLWKNVTDIHIQRRVSDDLMPISNGAATNSYFWNKNTKFVEVTLLSKQKKSKEAIELMKKFIPLKKFLIDINIPNIFYIENVFEYLFLKYGNDVYPNDQTIILNSKGSYGKPMIQLVYSLIDEEHYELCTQVVDRIIEKYNPISVFMRLEKIECLKVKKKFKDIYHATYECLKLSYKLTDISKCYRNFAFYFIETDQIECAIACLCKSAQFSVHISIVQELNHILKNNLKIKIDNLKRKQVVSLLTEEDINERNRLEELCETCEKLKRKFIDFLCTNRLLPISNTLIRHIPRNGRRYVLAFGRQMSDSYVNIDNTDQINTFSNIIKENPNISPSTSTSTSASASASTSTSASMSTLTTTQSTTIDTNTTNQNSSSVNDTPIENANLNMNISNQTNSNTISANRGMVPYIQSDKRTTFPVFEFNDEELNFIEKHMEMCKPIKDHTDPNDSFQMKLCISDRVISYYKLLINIRKSKIEETADEYIRITFSKSKPNDFSFEEFKKLGYIWNISSFYTINELQHIYNVLINSKKKSLLNQLLDILD